ncbi:MAG: hypothetical protein V3U84_06715 [Thiotrichaceae bacterium]
MPSFMRVTDTIDHGWLDYGLVQGEEYAVCDQNGVAFRGLKGRVCVEKSGYEATVLIRDNVSIPIYLDCVFAILSGEENSILIKGDDDIYVFLYGDMKRALLFNNGTLVADDFLDKITLLAEQMEAMQA